MYILIDFFQLNLFLLIYNILNISVTLFLLIGVADGVGGWRHYGIDPGEFSSFLMMTCERLVSLGKIKPNEPNKLLAQSYYELLENKQPILGRNIFILYLFLISICTGIVDILSVFI